MPILEVNDANMALAASTIRAGGLVAFPTETVYGLGANALDADAVAAIFAAKGRPATNPVIVHVRSTQAAAEVAEVNDIATRLMDAFWPGPLTLVLPRRANVPDVVTAGGSTVAVRQPKHPVAQRLLDLAGVPIAAPSANRSESISPTRAEHVMSSLGDRVDIILDGGWTEVGLESTVLDVTVDPPQILRPGMVTSAQIAEVLGYELSTVTRSHEIARTPGAMPRHYAPRTPLRIVEDVWATARDATHKVAVIAWRNSDIGDFNIFPNSYLGDDPANYAKNLYDVLHEIDTWGVDEILVEGVPDGEAWAAIRDRLSRAAAK